MSQSSHRHPRPNSVLWHNKILFSASQKTPAERRPDAKRPVDVLTNNESFSGLPDNADDLIDSSDGV